MKVKSAAVLTVFDAAKMDKRGRRLIATWLKRQAKNILEYGDRYSSRFTGRYLYHPLRANGGKNGS